MGFSGADLQKLCESSGSTHLACAAFMRGWSEGTEAAAQNSAGTIYSQQGKVPSFEEWQAMTSALRGFCPPMNIEIGQSIAVTLHFLSEHPEDWHLPAGQIVLEAMKSAFPCSTAQ